jgi:hypothetical protein
LFAKRINHKTTKNLYIGGGFDVGCRWLLEPSTNRKAVDEVVLGFVILLILLVSLSKEVYKVIVRRLGVIIF